MEPLIHYIKSGRNFGPVSVRDFLDLMSKGVVGPDDLVRVEGDGRWRSAALIAEQLREGRLSVRPGSTPSKSKSPSGMPPGSHTVFTSAPPIPKAPVPRELAGLIPEGPGCRQCGTRSNPDATFCKNCGMRLSPRKCSACLRENDSDARFCEQCGTRLGSGAPA